jgi:D-sedoheptulose 7-phosphate isomerase
MTNRQDPPPDGASGGAGASPELAALYPFLHGARKDPAREHAGLLESVRQKAQESVATKEAFFAAEAERLVAVARALAATFRGGGRLMTMGNGGSSCDASHIAVEFTHPVTVGRPSLPAFDLGADRAMLTSVGNDVGFEHVFARQLDAHGRRGDAVLGVSTSGNSHNLMRAFDKARSLGITTIGLAGGDGGQMAKGPTLDHCLVVRSQSIHRVQECHVAIYHLLWDLTHTLLADDRRAARPERTEP